MNETALLQQILPLFRRDENMLVPPGDDCALLKFGDRCLLAAADQVISNVHYYEDTPLDGAVAATTFVVAGKHAVLAIHNGGDEFATGVIVRDTLAVNHFACLGQKLVPYLGQKRLHLLYFVGRDGRTCIALDTASTVATLKVAQKLLFEYVE